MATRIHLQEERPTEEAARHRWTGPDVEAETLGRHLREAIRGEVRFDRGSRALYATDGSNYRQPPIGVVIPRDDHDLVQAMAICRSHRVPIFGRGGGTSLAGQCCNAAVCFDFSKYMNQVLEIDADRRLARVQPGTVLDDLRTAAGTDGLTFGPDPATHSHCTLGGMIGNNSCGVHSVMAQFRGPGPRTSDNVEWLDVITYDGTRLRVGPTSEESLDRLVQAPGRTGEIYRQLRALAQQYEGQIRTGIPDIPRRVSGYNLTALLPEHGFNVAQALVGSESTCVIVAEAMVRLVPNPKARSLVVLGYPSVFEAADHIPEVMAFEPIGCEGMDDKLVQDIEAIGYQREVMHVLPAGRGWLLVEFGADTKEEADAQAKDLIAHLGRHNNAPTSKLFDDSAEEHKVWKVREAGLGATAHVGTARPTWEGWEDSAVPPAKLGQYLRSFRKLLEQHHLDGDLYGHFGQGCVHTRITFDLETARGIRAYRSFVEDAADLVVSLGGSLSGEHGDGQSRGELLSRMYSPELMKAFHEFKSIWDPDWKMNPGKVIDPYRLDENLRLGVNYRPPDLQTHFQFPRDEHSFARATLRCVGIGECRRLEGGTMCPSFKVTREEMHSTRGRARLLFEMLEGQPLTGLWQAEEVKEALDLCLSCKGCKGDCPVSVDMATYKAEFLSHYYEKHRRPISAFAFGLIHYWARLGATAPWLVNACTQTPGLRTLARWSTGMSPERRVPPFAPDTFTNWFARRVPPPHDGRQQVLLWPDTFNNYFHPRTAQAAVHVLEDAGFQVHLPRASVCCGRPLFDYGMLDRARGWLRDTMRVLERELAHGTPIVGLEPSCVAVFRDELTELFPNDEDAKRLKEQVFTFSEFLERQRYQYPPLHRRAVLHGHCHDKAVLKFDAEQQALNQMGLDVHTPDSGCCGMAGSFGFEQDHYDVSMKVGELVLLPEVRKASRDTLIVADGFSCREQIAQATDRKALHLAEVVDMALREGPDGPDGEYPERRYVPEYRPSWASLALSFGLMAGALVVSVALGSRVLDKLRKP